MRLIGVFLAAGFVCCAQDWESRVRALRPADTRAGEAAVLDELQARAKKALDSIHHAGTAAEADRQRPVLRGKLLDSLGVDRLSWPPDLKARTVGTVRRAGYRIEKIVWQSLPGVQVPAHLYLPERLSGKAPAVLFYVGHWWTDSKARPDFQAFSINMARLGFVVLTWDPFGQGERGVSSREHRRVETLLAGVAQQGIAEYETRCALEYLLSRPEVDPKRIGMTGASGGGYNTWITTALDDRIAVAVPVVGTSEFYEQIAVTRALDWYHASEHCHFVPGLIKYANNHEFAAMAAPRPLMIIAASVDQSFPIAGVQKVVDYARGLYRAYGAADKFGFYEDSSAGHGYQQKKREAAYGWFLRWVMGRGNGSAFAEPATETEPFDSIELRCFPPGQNQPAGPGIVAAARKLAHGNAGVDTDFLIAPAKAAPGPDPVQRIVFPGDVPVPAFLIRGSKGVLIALHDAGKEAALTQPRVRAALAEGWGVLGIDPRGIGELATTQTGWVAAVSLLLNEYFVARQADDVMRAAAAFANQPLAWYAHGPNAVLVAMHAVQALPGRWCVFHGGFTSYRQFLDRPKSLEASYRLRPDDKDRMTAFDREIPFFLVPWKGLLQPDLPDLIKRSLARVEIVDPIDGDWQP